MVESGAQPPIPHQERSQKTISSSFSAFGNARTLSLNRKTAKDNNMEKEPIIISEKELLLIFITSLIVAGFASNYSTTCPDKSHVCIARGLAKTILDSVLQ